MDRLRTRIDSFLRALEEERYQIDRAQRRKPAPGALHERAGDLFSPERITEVQRALAGSGGVEEKRNRAILEFLARGRAVAVAADQLDQRLGWEVFGSVLVDESRIPVRQIGGALAVAGDPDRRHAIEEAYAEALDEQAHFARDYLARHRAGIAELGYGSHVEAYQVLGSIDLHAIAREGERFLAETDGLFRELLAFHLPRATGVEPGDARASDGIRLEAGVEYDSLLRGGEGHRQVLEVIGSTGMDPEADGRIGIEWEAYLGAAAGAVCRPVSVPDDVRLSVTPRSGRPAVASFLRACGFALHHAYTDPELSVEHRRLGDESVPLATATLFESLLRSAHFVVRLYGFPRARLKDYLSFAALCTLLQLRREIAGLRYELAYYDDSADSATYADLLGEATRLRHDPRAAAWATDGEFAGARRLRAAQLSATLAITLRNRFDED
ncbi:MAG TPA: hypothetical protein VMN39_06445, partial [Longimicrobiaceae bacterium]|nr:hypothetical protein [Longimicrobiaceae bacterium]